MTTTTINQLGRSIRLQMEAGNAVLLLGLPGIGKTQVAQQWLKENTDYLIVIDGSQTPEELVQGIPYVNQKGLSRELMDQMNQIKSVLSDENKTVGLNIEELSSFTQDDQRSIMNMILAGFLPDGTKIDNGRLYTIATANPSSFMDDNSDASVNDIENALFTRMAVYNVAADVESFLNFAQKNDFHPSIIYALKDKPELFEDTEHRTVPRTLEFLSNLLKIADKNGIDVSAQDFESLIGSENAPQFKYIYDHIKQLVSLLDVVTDQNAKNDFDQMSDAEKSFIWLNGLHNVTAAFDEQMVEIAQTLPADTLMATLKTDTIWSTNNNLATTQFLAGAYKALEDIE